MSDLDQQLRDLLHERAATVGPPPPLPPALRGDSRTPWLRRRQEWLLVPAVAVVTAAVVIAVALISSENGPGTVMPAEQAQSWAQEVCTSRPSAQSPSQDQVRGMAIAASAICWWENAANLGDGTVGLQNTTALSAGQIADLQGLLADAPEESATCSMIDSPPQVEYYVYLRDTAGQEWRVNVPEPACLGFDMSGGQYRSASLLSWLQGASKKPLLVTAKDWDGTSVDQARLEGILGVNEQGCVTVGDTVVMWPNTYYLGTDRAGRWVIVTSDEDSGSGYGTVLATQGERVVLAGGMTSASANLGPLPDATHTECLSDDGYWSGLIEVPAKD